MKYDIFHFLSKNIKKAINLTKIVQSLNLYLFPAFHWIILATSLLRNFIQIHQLPIQCTNNTVTRTTTVVDLYTKIYLKVQSTRKIINKQKTASQFNRVAKKNIET